MKRNNWITVLGLSCLVTLSLTGAPAIADGDRYSERHRYSQNHNSRWDQPKHRKDHLGHNKRHIRKHHRDRDRDIYRKGDRHGYGSHRHTDRHRYIYRKGYRHGHSSHRRHDNHDLIGGLVFGTLVGIILSDY